MSTPTTINITRVAGDTYPFRFRVTNRGEPVNVEDCAFELRIGTTPELVISCAIETDAAHLIKAEETTRSENVGKPWKARVHFSPLEAAQTPGSYAFTLKMTDEVDDTRTIARGTFTFE
jgi:hypothetical protein